MKAKTLKLSNLHEMLKNYRTDLPLASEYFAKATLEAGEKSEAERLTGSFKAVDEEGTVFQVDIWFEDGVQHRRKSVLCDYDTLKAETATSRVYHRRDRFAESF